MTSPRIKRHSPGETPSLQDYGARFVERARFPLIVWRHITGEVTAASPGIRLLILEREPLQEVGAIFLDGSLSPGFWRLIPGERPRQNSGVRLLEDKCPLQESGASILERAPFDKIVAPVFR